MKSLKNKNILVTGGAGFIGSSLVKRLVTEGNKVKVIDNLWRGHLDNLRMPDGSYAIDLEQDFFNVDLTDYVKSVETIRNIDLVFHLADIVGGIQYVFGNEAFVFRQNVVINSNVISACIENSVPNYVYVGTACSFPKHLQEAPGVVQLREEQTYPAQPESSYGWSKLMGEYESDLAQRSGKINVGLLRFHNVYGPGAAFEGDGAQALPSLIRKAIMYPDEPFVVWGSGGQYRDFVYIEDIIDALLSVANKGMNKGLIQIGSEKATTLRDAANKIIQISRKPIKPVFDTTKPEGDRGRIANCNRAKQILQWQPKVTLEDGLNQTYKWIEEKIGGG